MKSTLGHASIIEVERGDSLDRVWLSVGGSHPTPGANRQGVAARGAKGEPAPNLKPPRLTRWRRDNVRDYTERFSVITEGIDNTRQGRQPPNCLARSFESDWPLESVLRPRLREKISVARFFSTYESFNRFELRWRQQDVGVYSNARA